MKLLGMALGMSKEEAAENMSRDGVDNPNPIRHQLVQVMRRMRSQNLAQNTSPKRSKTVHMAAPSLHEIAPASPSSPYHALEKTHESV